MVVGEELWGYGGRRGAVGVWWKERHLGPLLIDQDIAQ